MAMVQPADTAVKANEILAWFQPIAPKPTLAAAAVAASLVVQVTAEGVVAANPRASAGAEDLAKVAAEARDVPVELDLLRKLLEPKVISPSILGVSQLLDVRHPCDRVQVRISEFA
ncbi:uncharacterized protein [Miscanthus floridulus]|uniref:uncharacterized protein n=1 Tax=Miscanthus floridulus TaxID=154761 RepID=UPI0034597476